MVQPYQPSTSGSLSPTQPLGPLGLPVYLFWDTSVANLDAEQHASYIIGRVLENGGLQDWHTVRNYYGDDRLRTVVTQLRSLSPRNVSLCCVALDLQPSDFRCCTTRPFPQAPWIS